MMYTVKYLVGNKVVLEDKVFLTKEQKERLECEADVVVM